MIASPCKNCPLRNQPKDECIKNCRLIQAIQDIEIAKGEHYLAPTAIDCTEELRYCVPRSVTRPTMGV